jgi:fructose-bisphosphate aldolase class II
LKFLTLSQILQPCVGHDYAVGAYDTCNLEITQAIAEAAGADHAPVIFMIYPHHTPKSEWTLLTQIIESEVARTNIKAALVLDHARTLDQIEYALELGFSGVMIDASMAPLEQNIVLTRRAVEIAHSGGVSVEAELGHVGQAEDLVSGEEQQAHLTQVDEARRFVNETGVDALAVSIGTLHGLYHGKPKLDFERLTQLRVNCSIPLVLHGGSDIPDDDIVRAIKIGIDKINIWTDVRIPFLRAMKDALNGFIEKTEVHEVYTAARVAAVEVIRRKNRILGSVGKDPLYRSVI